MLQTGETETVIRRSLGGLSTPARDRILDAVRLCQIGVGQLEASVRYHPGKGTVVGERMMIEQAPRALAESIVGAFGVRAPPAFTHLLDVAQDEKLPLITGWDLGAATPVAKLYVNASDLETADRRRLADRIRPEVGELPAGAGHVFGFNVGDGLTEFKCYEQVARFGELAEGLGPAAQQLVQAVKKSSLAVGAVVAWDVLPNERPCRRAFFLALRNAEPQDVYPMLDDLSGIDAGALAQALPFEVGPVTTVGISLRGPPRITVYVRREPLERWTVEPVAVFALGEHEISIFLDPVVASMRAYRVTKHHRVSFRARGPEATSALVDALMRWVVARVRAAEANDIERAFDQPPPAPWRKVR